MVRLAQSRPYFRPEFDPAKEQSTLDDNHEADPTSARRCGRRSCSPSLTGLLVVIGSRSAARARRCSSSCIAALINLGAYWFSDKIALEDGAREADLRGVEAPRLYQIVRELTTRADLPMPRLYMIPQDQPNAFATGRNPKHSAVAVTRGITKLLSEDELRGVLAHELAHIRNRDILIQSVAATIGARDHLPRLHAAVVRRRRRVAARPGRLAGAGPAGADRGDASSSSRSRASASTRPTRPAPRSAATPSRWPARCCASRRARRRSRCRSTRRPSRSTSSSRSRAAGIASLFSTHPPIEERVRRLRQMRPALGLAYAPRRSAAAASARRYTL